MKLKERLFILYLSIIVLLFASFSAGYLSNELNNTNVIINLHLDINATDMSGRGVSTDFNMSNFGNKTAIFSNVTGRYIELDNSGYQLYSGKDNHTYEFCFIPRALQTQYVIGHSVTGTPGNRFFFGGTAAGFFARIGNKTGTTITSFEANKEYCVAIAQSYDNTIGYGNFSVYIDGVLSQANTGYNVSGTPVNLTLCRFSRTGSENCNIDIDSFVVYNYTKTAAQVLTDYRRQFNLKVYISSDGSNTNTGLSEDDPIKTIPRLNSMPYQENLNNSFLFKCGSVFEEQYEGDLTVHNGTSPDQHVIYTSYGDCNSLPKPEFTETKNISSAASWTSCGTSLYCTDHGSGYLGSIICNNYTQFGKRNNSAIPNTQLEFKTFSNGTIQVYSTSNPATYCNNDLKVTPDDHIITFERGKYITFDGLKLRGTGGHGFQGGYSQYVNVTNCEISHIGGSLHGSPLLAYGNGVEFIQNSTSATVEYTNISYAQDAGFTIQAIDDGTDSFIYNFTAHHNIVSYALFDFEYFSSRANSQTIGVNVHHNTFLWQGAGYLAEQKSYGRIRMEASPAITQSFNFTDNIISQCIGYRCIQIGQYDTTWDGPRPNMQRNLYYNSTGSFLYRFNGTDYITLADLQTARSDMEISSVETDPLLVNADSNTTSDFKPLHNSVACTMDISGSYIGAMACASTNNVPDVPYFIYPGNNSHVRNGTTLELYFNGSDTEGDTPLTYYVFINGALNFTTLNNTHPVTFGNGIYNLSIVSFDGLDNSTMSGYYYFTQRSQKTFTYYFDQKPYFITANITVNYSNIDGLPTRLDADSYDYSTFSSPELTNDNDYNTGGGGDYEYGYITHVFNSINSSFNTSKFEIKWKGYNSGNYIVVYCYDHDLSAYTYITQLTGDGTTYYNNITLPETCTRVGEDLSVKMSTHKNSGQYIIIYETALYAFSDSYYTIDVEENRIMTGYNTTSRQVFLNFTDEANLAVVGNNHVNITFDSLRTADFDIINVSFEAIYNKSINVTILANSTTTKLNASCTYNNLTVHPLDELINYNASLLNQLNCSHSNYQDLSEYVTPVADAVNYSMYSAILSVRFYDESTDLLIDTENITVTIISDTYAKNFTTSTGSINITGIQDLEIEIRYAGETYRTRRYFVTTGIYQTILELYTVKNDNSSLIVFNAVDEKGFPVADAILKVQRYFVNDNAYNLVGMELFDSNGEGGMYLVPYDVPYIFIIEKNDEVIYTGSTTKIFSSTISLRANTLSDVLSSFILIDDVTTSLTYNNNTQILSFFWNDPNNLIQTGCLQVKKKTNGVISTLGPNCTSSASATIQMNMTPHIADNSDYTAIGTLETNTVYSLYPYILSDFIRHNKLYQATGKMGLFMAWFLVTEMFFVGLTVSLTAALILPIITLIILNMLQISFIGGAMIAGLGIIALVLAVGIEKKGQVNMFNYFIAVAVFSLIIVAFYAIPTKTNGFWSEYGYTPSANNISQFDQSSELKTTSQNMACDLNVDYAKNFTNICNTPSNPITAVTDFVQGLVRSGYAGLVTFYKSFGITKVLINNLTVQLAIPEEISAIAISAVLVFFVILLISFIFNRSDLG